MVTDAFKTVVIGWLVAMVTRGVVTHPVVVNTDKGKVQGKTSHVHGKKIDVFYGIPYARPPIGDLRFQHPQQMDPWTDTKDATTPPNCCVQQRDEFFGNFSGSQLWNPNTNISEDCLYLNVWTPHVPNRHDHQQGTHHHHHKAVFVWVYGGSFSSGSAALDIYDGKFLAAEYDVVVVSMQFRVGSLGYLSLGSPHSPGNAGIMDIRMSLEWIQRNIHRFGGSAHNVTLVGESSGAASVGLLMLSPIGRGLFHRAILQSAAPQLHWATVSFRGARQRSLELAEKLGCHTDRSDLNILKCLRELPATRFPLKEGNVTAGSAQFPFVPVVDGTFLSKPPMEYLKSGEFKKIPLLLGANRNEGTWLLAYANKDKFNRETDSLISKETYDSVINDIFMYYPQYPRELNSFGLDAIKFQYTDWLDPRDQGKRRDGVGYAIGDAAFSCGVVQLGQFATNHHQDVYMYSFSHRMSNHAWPEWMGVMHGDELFFVFGRPYVKSLGFSTAEKKLSKRIMKLWTNFVKTGNPNKERHDQVDSGSWPKYLPNDQAFLNISLDLVTSAKGDVIPPTSVHKGFLTKRCAFWEHYFPKLTADTPLLYGNCSRVSAATSSQDVLHKPTSGLLLVLMSFWTFLNSQR